jgi:predicted phosphodiesterase
MNLLSRTILRHLLILIGLGVGLSLASVARSWAEPASPEAGGSKWSFAIIGDTRDVTKASFTGISPVLADLAARIAVDPDRPEFVIHAGDITNGYWLNKKSPLTRIKGSKRLRIMYNNYLAAIAPLNEAGIPVYYVRGNHEFGGEVRPGTGVKQLIYTYNKMFARKMPQNGPADSRGLNYSFVYKSANFIVTDQYTGSQGLDVQINLPWIASQLAQNRSPLVFTFGHSPAYRTSTSEEYEFQLAAVQPERDQFWELLVRYNVVAYISSHEHFYARGKVRSVAQVVQGNGGATPMTYDPKAQDPLLTDIFPPQRVPAREMLPGYMVVTVDERTHKITFVEKCLQAGQIVVVDRFEVTGTGQILAQ